MAVKRQHEPQRVIGDLLSAEIPEKQARSIKYQMTIARLPLAKEIDDFVFNDRVTAPLSCIDPLLRSYGRSPERIAMAALKCPSVRVSTSEEALTATRMCRRPAEYDVRGAQMSQWRTLPERRRLRFRAR
jgi:hypothetical protein